MKRKKKSKSYDLTRFRPSELLLAVKANHLLVKIKSPLLAAKNHTVRLFKNKLRITITGHPGYDRELSSPLEYDLLIPKNGYRSVKRESFCNGLLTLRLTKTSDQAVIFIAPLQGEGSGMDC